MMNNPTLLQRLTQHEGLNFLLTNRIPRIALTRFMGWWSQIRHPWVFKASLWLWQRFSDLDLSEARQQNFRSLHECFIRELKPGSRPIDPDPQLLCSPCDAIVGACGSIAQGQVFQAKGFPYTLESLLGSAQEAQRWGQLLEGGSFVTLRLTSSMYHRFHAPDRCRLQHVSYISGDTWNVNPIALKRVERLFCKNERAVLHLQLANGVPFLLVPVAAVLVASMRLHAVDVLLHLRYQGPHEIPCDAPYERGEEMGWFQHGSTILLFVPPGFALADGVQSGQRIQMGQALLRNPAMG
jgi:phosphatidylserine decarboxylase